MIYFLISAAVIAGAYYMLKDIPGGKVQSINPNSFRLKPWDVA